MNFGWDRTMQGYFPRMYLRAGPSPYAFFLLGFVASRLGILAELVQSVVFRGAAIVVALSVRIGYVFALPLVQHDEPDIVKFDMRFSTENSCYPVCAKLHVPASCSHCVD